MEVGRRLKAGVLDALAGSGVHSVAVSGLANEYQGYFTTPEEYAWQAYEGGQTNFGKFSANLLVEETARLARSMAEGRPAPAPYPFDPTNGLEADHTPFSTGPDTAQVRSQPEGVTRLGRATFVWEGGPRGVDRRLDRAFVTVQRRDPDGWTRVSDDRGTALAWDVEGDEAVPLGPRYVKQATVGTYRARWEVPLDSRPGNHRFVVTAKRYRLASRPFEVRRGRVLEAQPVRVQRGRAAFVLTYPEARPYDDLTYRPQAASSGVAVVRVDGQRTRVPARPGGVFVVEAPAERWSWCGPVPLGTRSATRTERGCASWQERHVPPGDASPTRC